MTGCNHPTALRVAATDLIDKGKIATFDAVYRWLCPNCGQASRTTRLADTVYALRHAYGWVIDTHKESNLLAEYVLVKAGDMPGDESATRHPRKLVRDHAGAGVPPTAPAPSSYHAYEGKPVPVEAVPSAQMFECVVCGKRRGKDNWDLGSLLGGYRSMRCDSASCLDTKKKPMLRLFRPLVTIGAGK